MTISVPISLGDFFDRVTILEIKSERISDQEQLEIVNEALAEYRAIIFVSVPRHTEITDLLDELKCTNKMIWDAENKIRSLDRQGDYGADFVEVARSLCQVKGRRNEIKCEIDKALGCEVAEVKSYRCS